MRNQIRKKAYCLGAISLMIVVLMIGLAACRSKKQKTVEESVESTVETKEPVDTVVGYVTDGGLSPMVMEEENVFTEGKSEWHVIEENKVEYKGEIYYRNTAVKAILCMGVDRKDDMTGTIASTGEIGSADAIILVAQDTARNKNKLLMIPRDSIVKMEILDEHDNSLGIAYDHLCRAFVYGDGHVSSCENVVKCTSDLLCGLDIAHYCAIDLPILKTLNDAVGGVEVTIPNDRMNVVNDKWVKGTKVILHGDEAERFLRYRDINMDDSPISRMKQHEEYIKGFYKALLEKKESDSTIVDKLIDISNGYMITGMHKDEYLKIAMNFLQNGVFDEDDIKTLPCNTTVNESYMEAAVCYQDAIPILLEMFYLKNEE